MEKILLSIIIPAYNEAQYLPQTLDKIKDALDKQVLEKSAWEIIVCDNNSTDDTSEIAKKLGARIIQEPINQISRARNTGASIAQGKWLLFIDADTYPDSNLMSEVISIIQDDKLIGCGATVKVIDGSLINKLRMERLNPLFRLFNLSGGAFILVNKLAFETIKGFSENLYAYEEIDFIIRLKKYGRSIGKSFKVLHKNPIITSGRKVEFSLKKLSKMIISNFAAIVLFILHYILPIKTIQDKGKKFLGYWYAKKK